MKVAILGAGNAGCAVGTDLSIKGHEVTLIKTSNSMHDDNYNYMVEHNGEMTLVEVDGTVRHGRISRVTRDVSLISEAEVVIIYSFLYLFFDLIFHSYLHKKCVTSFLPIHLTAFHKTPHKDE